MGDYDTETLEDLERKLLEYRSSLATVEAALAGTSSEPQLTRLKNDLVEVIALTEDLLKFRVSQGEVTTTTVKDASIPDDSSKGVNDSVVVKGDKRRLVGCTCTITGGADVRFGEIVEATADVNDPSKIILSVDVIGKSQRRLEVQLDAVQVLPQIANLEEGTKCQAVATADGRVHTCVIEDNIVEKSVYRVKFSGLQVTEHIRYDRIFTPGTRQASDRQSGAAASAQQKTRKRKIKEIVTPGGYRIPEYLAPKPTDSQHQLLSKKKKVHMLKKEQRKEIIEKAAVQRQSAWLTHNRKVSCKRSKESIFTTSENPTARVGITGSGQPMTTFDKRERHEFLEIEE